MMYKKSVLVFLCLLAAGSCAFGSAWSFQANWSGGESTGTTEDWFDANNWSPQLNEGVGVCQLPPDWTVAAELDQKTPDVCIHPASSPYYAGADADGYDAACTQLCIHPWSWNGVTRQVVKVIDAKVNCGFRINVCGHMGFYSGTAGYGLLDVNGTSEMYTPGLRNFDPNDPYDPELIPDVNYQFIEGEGLWIGGGDTGLNPNWGRIRIYDSAKIVVPRIRINYGDINLIGAGSLLEQTDPCMADDRFMISLAWVNNDLLEPTNRINIIDGTLKLTGDRTGRVNYYIGKGRITAYDNHGMLTVGLDGDGNTVVTAVGDYNAAWSPDPIHLKENVSLTPTLTWLPGALVNTEDALNPAHAVYLGTDAAAVASATTASSEFMGFKQITDSLSYTVTTALEADTVYYWRVDEYNETSSPGNPWEGYVWQFKSLGGAAVEPIPVSGTVGLPVPLQLDWLPGAFATTHHLFFGTDAAAVADATTDNPLGVYIGTIGRPYALGNLAVDLARDTNYYWRIDEADSGAGYWTGIEAWMFRNTDYFVVEDFNSYEDSEDMNTRWVTSYDLSCFLPAAAGLQWSGVGGRLSYYYDNTDIGTNITEARCILNSGAGSDWTGGGALPAEDPIVAVAIAYLGNGTNTAHPTYDRMYIGIEDTDGTISVIQNPDANATRDVFGWSNWKVALSDLGVGGSMNQAAVKYFYLGIGAGCDSFDAGGTGTVLFDDVRLYQKSCEPDLNGIVGDLSADCAVNYADLDLLVADWLASGSTVNLTMTTPVDDYIARYNFDEAGGTTADDAAGTNDAAVVFGDGITVTDDKLWNTTGGYDGAGCINLIMNSVTMVQVPTAVIDTANAAGAVTIMGWVKMDYYSPTDWWPRFVAVWEPNSLGEEEEIIEIECPGPRPPSDDSGPRVFANWKRINEGLSTDGDMNSMSTDAGELWTGAFANQWNHYAFTFNSVTDKMRVYHNGNEVADSNFTVPMMTSPATYFLLGCRDIDNAGEQHWIGSLDDFRVYSREVSAGEIATIGSQGTGVYNIPLDSIANINTSGATQKVNFGDYALLAENWLEQTQWP